MNPLRGFSSVSSKNCSVVVVAIIVVFVVVVAIAVVDDAVVVVVVVVIVDVNKLFNQRHFDNSLKFDATNNLCPNKLTSRWGGAAVMQSKGPIIGTATFFSRTYFRQYTF